MPLGRKIACIESMLAGFESREERLSHAIRCYVISVKTDMTRLGFLGDLCFWSFLVNFAHGISTNVSDEALCVGIHRVWSLKPAAGDQSVQDETSLGQE